MKLASHNSWSYLPPKKWWMRPFAFMAKCQSKTIREQYEAGVRLFDLRIRFKDDGEPLLAHGLMEYPTGGLMEDLRFLNNALDGVTVQVILEVGEHSGRQEALFADFCARLRRRFSSVTFIGGRRKYDWEMVYNFHTSEPSIVGEFASAPSPKWYGKLNDLWPWLWAKRHNGKILKDYADYDGWVMMDYI